MSNFGNNEILLLLGAGASVDAKIPHSTGMVRRIEELVQDEWGEYRDLYNYIKSSIYHADGIRGRFSEAVNYNIERVVNTLDELRRREEHPLYPFVASWDAKLLEVADADFSRLTEFRSKIVEELRSKWLPIEYVEHAEYYKGLLRFQEQFQYPLKVFTLNYDLCVESVCEPDELERGFENNVWDWQLFELDTKSLYLYKLHGSTDWVRENGQLTFKNSPEVIDHEAAEMIFGTAYKMQYLDPFLFFAYELRKWTLQAKLLIAVGYGFGDDHINAIISQALQANDHLKVLSVSPHPDDWPGEVCARLDSPGDGRIVFRDKRAKIFFEEGLDIPQLSEDLFPEREDVFPEVDVTG